MTEELVNKEKEKSHYEMYTDQETKMLVFFSFKNIFQLIEEEW